MRIFLKSLDGNSRDSEFWIFLNIVEKVNLKYLPLRKKCFFKDGFFSGPYFPVFSPNTGKCGPDKTRYLDTFNAV